MMNENYNLKSQIDQLKASLQMTQENMAQLEKSDENHALVEQNQVL